MKQKTMQSCLVYTGIKQKRNSWQLLCFLPSNKEYFGIIWWMDITFFSPMHIHGDEKLRHHRTDHKGFCLSVSDERQEWHIDDKTNWLQGMQVVSSTAKCVPFCSITERYTVQLRAEHQESFSPSSLGLGHLPENLDIPQLAVWYWRN